MAAAPSYLSLEQFEERYLDQKQFEYWFGEAVQKSMPTSLHGKLQWIIAMLLSRMGWDAATEVRLKLSTQAQPIPDVIGHHTRLQHPYPTEPVDLCVEILSPADNLQQVFAKCAHYLDWGVRCVWIVDGEGQRAFVMSRQSPAPVELQRSDILHADADHPLALPLAAIFDELDRHLSDRTD